MSEFLSWVGGLFELLFAPVQRVEPVYGLALVSVLTGVLLVLVFRFTSNQKEIKRVKDRIKAHLLEVRLFQDQLGVVLKAHLHLLQCTLSYMKHSLKPLAVMLLPMVLLLAQLEMHLGRVPPRPNDTFLLVARLGDPAGVEQVSLILPPGLTLGAPALRLRREVNWRLRAEEYGDFEVGLAVAERTFTKQIRVTAEPLARLSARRVRASIIQQLLYPGESPLPDDSPLEVIEVRYPPRRIDFGLYQGHWLVPFFVFSLLAGFAVKGLLRTEI